MTTKFGPGTQGGNFRVMTHVTTDSRRRPLAEQELLTPNDKRKKSDEEINVENQGEILNNLDSH